MEQIKENLRTEVEQFSNEYRFGAAYKRRKLLAWSVRTILSVILYIIFWKHEWVRWTLVLYIPLTIFNLVMIFALNYLIDKKVKKLNARIDGIGRS